MLSQLQSQRQQFKILPQQIHLLNFFYLNSLELQQRIKNELEENPFLDTQEEKGDEKYNTKLSKDHVHDFESSEESMYEDRPDYKTEYQNYFDEDVNISAPIVNICNFKEDAKMQLQLLEISEDDKACAEYIVDALTPQGLMDRALEEVADEMSFHFQRVVQESTIVKGLAIVRTLDPIGIGARSIHECLLIQLHRMDTGRREVRCATKLLEDYYEELMQRKFEKLQHLLKIDDKELKAVLGLIGGLKFHPVSEMNQHDPKHTIIPDFAVTVYDDKVQVNLCASKAGDVFVNKSLYDQLAKHIGSNDRAAGQYVKNKLDGAMWFANAIKQREDTMMRIMECIIILQHEYFITGDIKYLRPMVLRNVAEKTGLDISTISRITSNKYADTPFGLIYLKRLFSEGIPDKQGEVISNKVIKSILGDTIESENKNKPYTDQQLVKLMALKGVDIARRTVAKYRTLMQIPIAQIRAVWA